MSVTFRRISALTLLGLVAALLTVVPGLRSSDPATASGQGTAPSLLGAPTAAESAPSARPKAGTVRSRTTTMDAGLLPAKADGQRIRLNLFTDADYTATVTDKVTVDGATTWSGHLDRSLSTFQATRVGDAVIVSVNSPDGAYSIIPGADGSYVTSEVESFQPTKNDATVPSAAELARPAADSAPSSLAKPKKNKGNRATGDTGRVDILIAYTPQAVALAGGDPAVVQAQIAQAVAQANQAFATSGIGQTLNAVGVVATPTNEFPTLEQNLDLLGEKNDGSYDELHGLRAQTKADLVALWLGHDPNVDQYCGLANYRGGKFPAAPEFAFSTTSSDPGCQSIYTFAHEVGHNIGAMHDDAPGVQAFDGVDSRAHGYVNVASRWQTVMSYFVQCTRAGVRCTPLLNFSNPGVLYGGEPTGSAAPNATGTTSQNAVTVSEVGAEVNGYFQSQIYPAVPIVKGKARLGGTLKLLEGTWVPGNAKVKSRWYVNGKAVKGKKGKKATFLLTRKQVGKTVTAVITGSAASYSPVAVTAGPFEIQKRLLKAKTPKLKGKAKVGKRLNLRLGKTKPGGATVKIKWYNSSGKIKGAKKRVYKVRKADAGLGVFAVVTFKKNGYETVKKTTEVVTIS